MARIISAPYYTKSGSKGQPVALPKEIFGQEPNPTLLAQAVRVYLANQRRAHAKTKGRGEVRLTKAKWYRQKGTGRARHGARSAPIFVGGGIAHGPRGIENYEAFLPKKMRKLALTSALSTKLSQGDVLVADLEKVEPKTKAVAGFLKKIGIEDKAAIVHSGKTELYRAGRNIRNLSLIPVSELNTYQVLASGKLILTSEAVGELKTRRLAPRRAK